LFVRHEVERQLALVSSIGAVTTDTRFSLHVVPQDLLKARALLKNEGVNLAKPWVVVHPNATAPSRRYPPHLYAAVIRKLIVDHGLQIVLTGTAQEAPLAEEIQSKSRVRIFSLMGKTGIPAFAGVLRLAPLLLSNNTGSIHIAAATETPVVVLYALTNMQHTPWQVPHKTLFYDTPCKLCYKSECPMGHHACLRNVQPNTVVEAVCDLLRQTLSHSRPTPHVSMKTETGG